MICNRIEVEHFRNIERASVSFSEGVNVLLGANAQGKTNLLEAIYVASGSRSFRAFRDAELVQFGSEYARVDMDFTAARPEHITMKFTPGRRRLVEINKNKITRLSDMMGRFRCVLFSPEHLELIKGAPAVRRDFLDNAISQLRPMYGVSLEKYEKILKERNALLKTALEDRATFDKTIDYWSQALAHEAAILSRFRESYVRQAGGYLVDCFRKMSQKTGAVEEVPSLAYQGSAGLADYSDLDVTKARYETLLRDNREREIYAGTTLYGIHKDDLVICLGGREARMYASQGQQRSLALALKLAEGELVRKECGEYPVFLLDDVLSELDFARRAYLIEEICDKQVIMTTCEIEKDQKYKNARIIRVKKGIFTQSGGEETKNNGKTDESGGIKI